MTDGYRRFYRSIARHHVGDGRHDGDGEQHADHANSMSERST